MRLHAETPARKALKEYQESETAIRNMKDDLDADQARFGKHLELNWVYEGVVTPWCNPLTLQPE